MTSSDLSWLGTLAKVEDSPAYDVGKSLRASTCNQNDRASLPSMTESAAPEGPTTTTLKRQNAVRHPKNRRTLPTIDEVLCEDQHADGADDFVDDPAHDNPRHTTGSRFYEHIERPETIRTVSETDINLGLGGRIKRWVNRVLDR